MNNYWVIKDKTTGTVVDVFQSEEAAETGLKLTKLTAQGWGYQEMIENCIIAEVSIVSASSLTQLLDLMSTVTRPDSCMSAKEIHDSLEQLTTIINAFNFFEVDNRPPIKA